MLAIVTGCGRCGTNSVTRFLEGQKRPDGCEVAARHETDWREIVADMMRGREDLIDDRLRAMGHDIEVSPFLSLLSQPPLASAEVPVRLVGLIRDGRWTVRSGMTNGWYWNPEADPEHWVTLQPRFEGDRFAICCQFWSWTYRRLVDWAATIYRLEGLVHRQADRDRLLAELGLAASNRPFPHENQTGYDSIPSDPSPATTDAGVAWPAPFPAPNHWTKREHKVFEQYCGEMMDELYPGWREDHRGESG